MVETCLKKVGRGLNVLVWSEFRVDQKSWIVFAILEAMHFLNESCLFLNAEPSDCPKITTTIEEYHSEIVPQLGDRHFLLKNVEHLPSFTFEKLFLKCSLYSQSSY